MFERYTERARRVLFFARYESSQLGSISIEPEHLLLGLVREGKGPTSRILAASHVSLDDIRLEIERRTVFRRKLSTSVEIPFSPPAKRVLQFAAEEADGLSHAHIGTEHLLLGLLREERSVAAEVLRQKGIRTEAVRDLIARLSGKGQLDEPEITPNAESAAGHRYHGPPAIAPSYECHVSRTAPSVEGRSTTSGPRYWTASGFSVRSIIARLLRVEERRVELPEHLDTDDRYDFALHLPVDEGWNAMELRALKGVERRFGVSITRDSREQDVYTLSLSGNSGPGLRHEQYDETGGGAGFGSFEYATLATDEPPTRVPSGHERITFGDLRMSGLTIDDLCVTLEEMFGKPFVNDTGLAGAFEISVVGEFSTAEAFFEAMRDQLGLAVIPARRAVETVVVRRT